MDNIEKYDLMFGEIAHCDSANNLVRHIRRRNKKIRGIWLAASGLRSSTDLPYTCNYLSWSLCRRGDVYDSSKARMIAAKRLVRLYFPASQKVGEKLHLSHFQETNSK
ncbi:MAG: hypothetical protein ACTSYV_01460, partial [Candidatus Heimdallarchaeaceae archaeon]